MKQHSILNALVKAGLIKPFDYIGVAVSGGIDSVCLLDVLHCLRNKLNINIAVLHVNHQLRGRASDADEEFVRKIAKKRRLPFYVLKVDVKKKSRQTKMSLEEAARELRYDFFRAVMSATGMGKIAIAHTLDDQAETVLMRLIGGAGLKGLRAIHAERKLEKGLIIRPFIEISREEIEGYVRMNRLKFRVDRSNESTKFLRNKIRHKLLPFLAREFNPKIKKTLARLPALIDVDLNFLEKTSDSFYKKLAKIKTESAIEFPRKLFLRLDMAVQYRLLERAMREMANAELDSKHWNLFCGKTLRSSSFQLQFPKNCFISVRRDVVKITAKKERFPGFSRLLSVGETAWLPEIGKTIVCEAVDKKPRTIKKSDLSYELFDAQKLSFPLLVRNRKPGDRFQPLGQRKPLKLKKLLINKRIPVEERDQIPVIESAGKIIWVAGVAMGETAKVVLKSNRIIRISIRETRVFPLNLMNHYKIRRKINGALTPE